jgi:hypothetical protein
MIMTLYFLFLVTSLNMHILQFGPTLVSDFHYAAAVHVQVYWLQGSENLGLISVQNHA